jgi:Zn-dependent protease with chaperone function
MALTDIRTDAASGWIPWTAAERESFFSAIARHNRAAWRVTVASAAAIAFTSAIVATLMAPLFYAAIALAFDLLNLIVPAPNLVKLFGDAIGPAIDHPEAVAPARWLQLALYAALPGLVWMALVVLALRRMLLASALFGPGPIARPCNPSVLEEQRLANVVGEMAIAAELPAPRVEVTDQAILNGVIFGRDEREAKVLVSEALLARLSREELQGVAGHLVGSIANGDMAIGLRASVALSLFALVARMSAIFPDGAIGRHWWVLWHAILVPTSARARQLALELGDPFGESNSDSTNGPTGPPRAGLNAHKSQGNWRTLLWLPLAGPIVITGFFAGLVNLFVLSPLVSLAWRQRKYMADATAVRLTRDPDALAHALEKMSGAGAPLTPWTAHLSVIQTGGNRSGPLGASVVPMFPSLDRRLRALAKLGAHVSRPPRRMPLPLVLILAALCAVVGLLIALVLYLLVILSTALTMLFTGLPFGVLHLLLRWLGH